MATNDELGRFLSLSGREREVLGHFCKGLEYSEIAEMLVLSPGVVSNYMSRAYRKLDLFELSQMSRLRQIAEVYCPLFDVELEEPEINEVAEADTVIDIPSSQEEKILHADEKALVAFRQVPLAIIPSKKIEEEKRPKRRRGGCCLFFSWGFFLLILTAGVLAVYGWIQWQNGNLDLSALPFEIPGVIAVASEPTQDLVDVELTEDTETKEEKPDATQVPTKKPANTSVPPSNTPVPPTRTSTPKPPTKTPVPTATKTPKPLITGPVYELGEWHEEDGLAIRLLKYDTYSGSLVFTLEIWNKTANDIYFSYGPVTHTFVIDNLGRRHNANFNSSEDIHVGPQERGEIILAPINPFTTRFRASFLYDAGVTDIYFLIEDFSRFEKVYWHIEIGK